MTSPESLDGISKVLENAPEDNLVFFRDAIRPTLFTGVQFSEKERSEPLETQWRLGVAETMTWRELQQSLSKSGWADKLGTIQIDWRLPDGSVLSTNLPLSCPLLLCNPS